MSKDEVFILEAEYQAIISQKAQGLTFIPSLHGTVNLNSVESILPEDSLPKKDFVNGRLNDGTRAIKKFGQWVPANNPEARLDPDYYPEAYNDTVMSEEEYQHKQLLLENPKYENSLK